MNTKLYAESRMVEPLWKEAGLLEGIKDKHLRACTAVLLENQRLYNDIINESGTDTSDVANFRRISIPLVRRIFPQLIANKIVSVQPLLGPVGLVYYLRFRYSTDKGTKNGVNNGFPGDDANSLQQLASGDANLDVYYSSSFIQNETSSTDSGAATSVAYSPLKHTPVIAGSVAGTLYKDGTAIQTFTVSSGGTFTFSDIGTVSGGKGQASGSSIDLTTGVVTISWTSAASADTYFTINYEYNMECNQDLPEINLGIENEEIMAHSRKLKAVWSWEAQQDVRSQFALDVEQELTSVLAQEVNLEIDREIIGDLRTNAGTVSTWDLSTALGDTIKEKYESLYIKVTEVANVVHRKTLRGAANWIVTSPEVASIFETATAGFAPAPSETFTSSLGVQYVGSTNKRFQLYKDPAFPINQLLMGYKGDNYMDAGYFYCPYVPLTRTPVVLDPESLCPRVGLITRYGKKLLRDGAKFYARLNIANHAI